MLAEKHARGAEARSKRRAVTGSRGLYFLVFSIPSEEISVIWYPKHLSSMYSLLHNPWRTLVLYDRQMFYVTKITLLMQAFNLDKYMPFRHMDGQRLGN